MEAERKGYPVADPRGAMLTPLDKLERTYTGPTAQEAVTWARERIKWLSEMLSEAESERNALRERLAKVVGLLTNPPVLVVDGPVARYSRLHDCTAVYADEFGGRVTPCGQRSPELDCTWFCPEHRPAGWKQDAPAVEQQAGLDRGNDNRRDGKSQREHYEEHIAKLEAEVEELGKTRADDRSAMLERELRDADDRIGRLQTRLGIAEAEVARLEAKARFVQSGASLGDKLDEQAICRHDFEPLTVSGLDPRFCQKCGLRAGQRPLE